MSMGKWDELLIELNKLQILGSYALLHQTDSDRKVILVVTNNTGRVHVKAKEISACENYISTLLDNEYYVEGFINVKEGVSGNGKIFFEIIKK